MKYNELINKLEVLHANGILKFQTTRTRITAIKKIFEMLPELRDEDVLSLNIDMVQERFLNEYKDEVSLPTIATYVSRLRSSIAAVNKSKSLGLDSEAGSIKKAIMPNIEVVLRQDFKVSISGLPADLTESDVDKLSKVLRAYCI